VAEPKREESTCQDQTLGGGEKRWEDQTSANKVLKKDFLNSKQGGKRHKLDETQEVGFQKGMIGRKKT